jgi:hypothetical protein
MDQQQQTAVHSLNDPQLYRPLLLHSSVSQDQRVVVKLLQTSKQLQEAVEQLRFGQLQAVLSTAKVQQAESLVQWVCKHARLLQALDVQLISSIKHGGTKDWAALTAGLAAALQDATAHGALAGLHSFALKGIQAGHSLLQALSAAQIQQLVVQVPKQDALSLSAVAALTSLRSLQLTFTPPDRRSFGPISIAQQLPAQDTALQPLAAGVQQLTELRIGPVYAAQLEHLPPQLQQLHVTVDLGAKYQQLLQLASWIQQHGSIISSLQLVNILHVKAFSVRTISVWDSAVDALGAAFEAAAAKTAAAAAAAGAVFSAYAMPCRSLQLQSLSFGALCHYNCTATPALLQQLPGHSLTHLESWLGRNPPAQLAALCRLTALRSLQLGHLTDDEAAEAAFGDSSSALAPLMALQHLTALQLPPVDKLQLAALQLPKLQQLQVELCGSNASYALQIGHMTTLQSLRLTVFSTCGTADGDQLPPFLEELCWDLHAIGSFSVQPLLGLTRLQRLWLKFEGQAPAAAELAQLSCLKSLQDLKLSYSDVPDEVVEAAAAEVWPVLPLVGLYVAAATGVPLPLLEPSTMHLSGLQRLTRLHLSGSREIGAVPGQLAALLRQLPALQDVLHDGLVTITTLLQLYCSFNHEVYYG